MKITVIGCGNMGGGLAKALASSHTLFLYDRNLHKAETLAHQTGGTSCPDLLEAIGKGEVIFLAVKPSNLNEIGTLMSPHLHKEQIIISVLAGTPLSALERYFTSSHLVRIMPNLAIQYGAGVIGVVNNPFLPKTLREKLEELLAPMGGLYWIQESQIDALTALASSGPAFMYALIEAMIAAGVAMGFESKEAAELVMQMLQGCMKTLEKTGESPAELIRQIASPNGTTQAGLRVLEKENIRGGVIETFLTARKRAQELACNDAAENKMRCKE